MNHNSDEVEGFEEVLKNLSDFGNGYKRVEGRAVKAGATIVLERMKQEVPVSDINGESYVHIRDDLGMSGIRRVREGTAIVLVGPGKKTAWRAKFLEFGTIKMPPNAFISRASSLSRLLVKVAIMSELKKGLKLR
ncbi:HK97 gp10 family phage protein [Alkalihalophilus lindianensis]|uniref:HK97 gp10 family phage protein n=1 Tax=Alkalihalophilus lindianensis TaxID=1630542 RepID=A0ABU3X7K2_9BACI|nr:HK97-gp10 family putative phage morphogenesis protein [Alkalihalophilus lindianensis]MDV2683804.1 HK97 gp10 family phage protein [Alkalihalophilus lindianensis]MDV2683870.1 HK97 gp10 family phage protein [Alkalihalophilus lindianensis]